MKKSFFVLGVAVAALASCTNEEVVDMPQSRAIQFGTFVNHSTRSSVTETTEQNLQKFFVFGNYDDSWTSVYTNVQVDGGTVGAEGTVWNPTQTAYWINGKKYRFGAYSNGGNKIENAEFNATSRVLTFPNYSVDNTIRLAIYSKRFLIHTMKLVGASWGFIRGPFLRKNVWNRGIGERRNWLL